MNSSPHPSAVLLAAVLAAAAGPAAASCGAAFCTLMSDHYLQGGDVPAQWRADLRLEAVTQRTLQRGSHSIAPSDVTGEEALERRTRNLNLVAAFERGLDEDWSLALRVPLVARDHEHDLIDGETGALGAPERWRFTRLGDVQLLLRRRLPGSDPATAWAVYGGLKLPTGSYRIANADGQRAERALQPGSGTTDGVLGLAARHALGPIDAMVAQGSLSQPFGERAGFEPGRRLELSLAWSHAWSDSFGSVLQLNLRHQGRDRGSEAEPEQSGGRWLYLSPGLTWAAGHAASVYAYLQLPLAQRVNGIQLVPRHALALGWTGDF